MNSNATFINGKAALGFVVRSYIGEVILLITKVQDYGSLLVAELNALEWAIEIFER